jgi:cytosolic carboxypeptidase protein 5
VRFSKDTNGAAQLYFEHGVEVADDKLFFAFTYPYTYTMAQTEMAQLDEQHQNNLDEKGSIYYHREIVTHSLDGRRIDLLTISSVDGCSTTEHEPLLSGLFPECRVQAQRPLVFPDKEVVFVSARVHSGEVPAQHTFKGILNLLMDPNDLQAKELRARYVFKLIPMLNPDGTL